MAITSLAAVKAYRNVTTTEHDTELARLIPAVEQYLVAYCGRQLERTTVTEDYTPAAGQRVLRLRQYPVASVTAVYDDPTRQWGTDTLVPASAYVVEAATGLLTLTDRTFRGGPGAVRVVYTAGYAPGSPELAALEQAAIELIWLARLKGDQALLGLRSRAIADGRIETYATAWPAEVRDVLDRYRRVDY